MVQPTSTSTSTNISSAFAIDVSGCAHNHHGVLNLDHHRQELSQLPGQRQPHNWWGFVVWFVKCYVFVANVSQDYFLRLRFHHRLRIPQNCILARQSSLGLAGRRPSLAQLYKLSNPNIWGLISKFFKFPGNLLRSPCSRRRLRFTKERRTRKTGISLLFVRRKMNNSIICEEKKRIFLSFVRRKKWKSLSQWEQKLLTESIWGQDLGQKH